MERTGEKKDKTSQELRMLSSVTINCQVRMIDWIQVLNCQNCNQCLKCQVSRTVFPIVKNCLNVIKNCHKTSQELWILSRSLSIQRSQCIGQCLKCHAPGHKNFQKLWKHSKLSKLSRVVKNCQNCQNFRICKKISNKLSKLSSKFGIQSCYKKS